MSSKHLHAALADVDFVDLHAEGLHEPVGIAVGLVRRGKPRHRVGLHAGAGIAQQIHRPCRDDESMGGIEAAGDADDDVFDPRGLQALGQPLDLDVVGLVAALVALCRVRRHIGKAGVLPGKRDAPLRDLHGEGHLPVPFGPVSEDPGVLAETRKTHPVLDEAVQVDVGKDHLRLLCESLRFGKQRAVLIGHGLAVPGQVRRRLAGTRRRIEVSRNASCRLVGRQAVAVFGFADGDVRGREVGEHRGTGQRRKARRGNGDPEVFADFDVKHEPRDVFHLEEQVRPERNIPLPAECDRLRQGILGGAELPALVILPVIRQVGFQGDSQDPAAIHDDGAVEEKRVNPERRPHDEDRVQALCLFQDKAQCFLDPLQEGFLVKEVLVGVGRKPQLREQGEKGLICCGLLRQGDRLFRVEAHIGDADLGDANGGPDEAVAV